MAPSLSSRCSPGSPCRQRRSASSESAGGVRWTAVAVALVALFLTLNGARWLLHDSPPAANELLVATCALDSFASDEAPLRVCTETRPKVQPSPLTTTKDRS